MEMFSEKTRRYLDELADKCNFYVFVIVSLILDGLFIAVSGIVLSKVHYEWLPALQLDGYYRKIIDFGAYSLDVSILPSLVIKLLKDIWKSIKNAFNDEVS
jgi:hypothetical protein